MVFPPCGLLRARFNDSLLGTRYSFNSLNQPPITRTRANVLFSIRIANPEYRTPSSVFFLFVKPPVLRAAAMPAESRGKALSIPFDIISEADAYDGFQEKQDG